MFTLKYFLETTGTIESGVGFAHFGLLHLTWLVIFAVFAVFWCRKYRNAGPDMRKKYRRGFAWAVIGDELFKMFFLTVGGRYTMNYLPFHLCSINIIMIAIHAFKPSKLLDNFLYITSVPGALSALLFPTWTKLPLFNFMHLHSFTVHILLTVYPLMLVLGGDIKPDWKYLGKVIGFLMALAVPIYGFNVIFDTNYMFLMEAEKGNPLLLFEQMWGNHLYGFPVIIAAVVLVMYGPYFWKDVRRKSKGE